MTSLPAIGQVIGVYGTRVGTDGEPGIVPFVGNPDISLVTGDVRVYRSFVMDIELMAKNGCGIGVVQNGLIR